MFGLLTPGAYLASRPPSVEGLIKRPEVSIIGIRDSLLGTMVGESMTDSMVVDSTMVGVSMVDMEVGMEVGMRGRELGSRGVQVEAFREEGGDCGREGNLAGLASLSIMITFENANADFGQWVIISDIESALNF